MATSPVSPAAAAPVVITIDANTDAATQVGWAIREDILYRFITGRVGQLVRCQGPRAVRAEVVGELDRSAPSYVVGISHGVSDCYSGFQIADIFRVGAYSPKEVRGRIVHFTACDTAAVLGPDMVARGAAAFIGYDGAIVFPPELSQALFDCDAEIDRSLLGGATAGSAFNACVARYNAFIAECRRVRRGYLAEFLAINRDRLRLFGDPGARVR